MRKPIILMIIQFAGFWPVWRWYYLRSTEANQFAWILPILALIAFCLKKPTGQASAQANHLPRLIVPAAVTFLYVASFAFAPPLVRAILAVTAISATVSALKFHRIMHIGTWGLSLLSLPVMASAQFFGGYPLRVVSAAIVAPLLRIAGYAVLREGVCLNWYGQLIAIDAPCSGVRMLWAAMFLVCLVACVLELSPWRTILSAGCSIVAVVLANALRSSSLFFLEAGLLHGPDWYHDAIGIAAFVLVGVLVLLMLRIFSAGDGRDDNGHPGLTQLSGESVRQ